MHRALLVMKNMKLFQQKKARIFFLFSIVVSTLLFSIRANAGNPLYPQGLVYYPNSGVKSVGDATTPNSFVQGIAYRSNISGQSMWDPLVSFNVADGVYPAFYSWDVGSSAWTTSPMVGDIAMTVFETRDGLRGWVGGSWVGAVRRVIPQSDLTNSTIDNQDVVMEPIPTPAFDAAGTNASQIKITWTGLWDNTLGGAGGIGSNSVVGYSIYRSVNGGAYQVHGSPYAVVAQNAGATVAYTDTSVALGNTYKYKITVNFEWNNHAPTYYETIGEGPESTGMQATPPDPDRIGFLSAQQSFIAGTNSSVITIETRETGGTTAAVKSDTMIDLSSNSTSLNKKFYSVSAGACTTTQITQVQILTGSSTAQFCYYDEAKSSPTWTITAHKSLPETPAWVDGTQAVTVNAAAVASIRIDNAAGGTGTEIGAYTMTADNSLTLYAIGFDTFGNYSGNVNVTWSSDGTLAPTLSGTGTSMLFSPTIAPASGTITANDGLGHIDVTGAISITPGIAATFDIIAPSAATAGISFDITSVTAKDADGNLATGYTGAKTLSYSGPANGADSGTPTYTTSATFNNGVANTIPTTLVKAETVKITATQGSVSGQSGDIVVSATTAAHLHITAPANVTAGISFDLTSIYAHDVYGNPATTYSGTKILSYSGPAISALGDVPTYTTSVDFTNGISTTTLATRLYARETVVINANDGSINGNSGNIIVGAGASGSMEYVSGDSQIGTVSQNLAQPLVVRVKDIYGNLKDGQAVSWAVTGGDGSFSPISSTSASDGTAQSTWKLGSLAGAGYNMAEARVVGLTGSPVQFDATGFSGTVSLLEVITPANAVAGVSFTITIKALDSFGNVAAGFNGIQTVSYSGPGNGPKNGAPTYTTSVDFINGEATLIPTTLVRAETVSLRATIGIVYGDSLPIDVASAPSSAYEIISPATATVNAPFDLTSIRSMDPYGNFTTDVTGTKTLSYSGPSNGPAGDAPTYVTSVDFSAGVATTQLTTMLTKAEVVKISVTDGTLSGMSGNIAVTYADPIVLVYVSGNNQTALPSEALANPLVAIVLDKDGNPVSGRTVHFAPTSGTLNATDVITAADGLASVDWTLGASLGLQITNASVSGISTTVIFMANSGVIATPKIAITTIPQEVNMDTASGVITACIQDTDGNNISAPSNIALSLASSVVTGKFAITSSGPWTAVSATVATGQACTNFYYIDSVAGVRTLTVSAIGYTSSSQSIFVKNPQVATVTGGGTTIINNGDDSHDDITNNKNAYNTYNTYNIVINNYYYYGSAAQEDTTTISVKQSPFPVITSPRDGSVVFIHGDGVAISGTARSKEIITVMDDKDQILGAVTTDNRGIWQLYVSASKFTSDRAKIHAKSYKDDLKSAPVNFMIRQGGTWVDDLINAIGKISRNAGTAN